MPANPGITNATASAAADAVTALLANGYLRIYDGTQPATPNTALGGGNHMLAQPRFGSPAFGASANGVASANAITADGSAAAGGTAAFCRLFKSDGTTAVCDGSVGVGSQTINAATAANPTVMSAAAHGLTTGMSIVISGFSGNWAPCNGRQKVIYQSAGTFSIAVDASTFGAVTGSPVFANGDLLLDNASISLGATVSVTSFTYTQPGQ